MSVVFKSEKVEMLSILLPGFLAIPLYYLLVNGLGVQVAVGIIALWLLDPGHSYAMFLRTYFNKKEMKRTSMHLVAPVVIFVGLFCWHYLGVPFLWTFIFYYSVYHYIRQYYGFYRLYDKGESKNKKYSHYILYSLLYISLIGLHFRGDIIINFYSDRPLDMFPSADLYNLANGLWWFVFFAGLVYELHNSEKFNRLRLISIFSPGVLFYFCLMKTTSVELMFFSIICSHAIPYISILSKSMPTVSRSYFSTKKRSFIVVLLAVLILGPLGAWSEMAIDFDESYREGSRFWTSVLAGLVLMPGILHYYIDSKIWRKEHPDTAEIFKEAS